LIAKYNSLDGLKKHIIPQFDGSPRAPPDSINSNVLIAENGSSYGEISEDTGRPKTVYVNGYTRQDGTYVKSHFRSLPSHQSVSNQPTLQTSAFVAENGSYYGQPNQYGVPKTVHVNGYYRKDGTYVRGHYRSAPRR
jgi:molybdate-binding protein